MSSKEENKVELDDSFQLEEEPETNDKEDLADTPRCYWCHKTKDEVDDLFPSELYRKNQETPSQFHSCSVEHEMMVKQFFNYSEKIYYIYFTFVLVFPLILAILTAIFYNLLYVFPIFMSLGIGLMIVPLMGNRIVRSIGLKNANILGRIFGAMLLLIGVILLLTNGLKIFAQS